MTLRSDERKKRVSESVILSCWRGVAGTFFPEKFRTIL